MRDKTIYFKYLYYLVRYGSIRKVYNNILNNIEKRLKKSYLRSLPVNIIIEPCNICDLSCPGCITGIRHAESIDSGTLDFYRFRCIFDKFKDYVFNISLYNWGEPFLNKDIFQMISYTTSNKCGVTIHSNFNIFNESMAEKAILSRLTHIYLSIDGATQQTYEKYRKGGNLSRVFKNIEIILNKKREMKSIFPILTWKYLVFPHNIHEIQIAKQKAQQLGVNSFETFSADLDNIASFGIAKRYNLTTSKIESYTCNFCNSLWSGIIIYPDGSILPCCQAFRKKDIFDNILDKDIRKVWNNDDFVSIRRMIATKKTEEHIRYPCCECEIIKNISHP